MLKINKEVTEQMREENNVFKDAFHQVLTEQGTQLLKNPKRLAAILRDYYFREKS